MFDNDIDVVPRHRDGETYGSDDGLGVLYVRRVVDKRPAAGGVQLVATGLRVPGPEDQGGGHRQWRVHTGQQHAGRPGSVAGQVVPDCASVEGRSGVHA